MKMINNEIDFIAATEEIFLDCRKLILDDPTENQNKELTLLTQGTIGAILLYMFGRKNCLALERIHGGMDGIMEALERVGGFNAHSDDLSPIIPMIPMFQQMLKDYKKGPKFIVKLGWHITGEKKSYTFK
jgi:hypothetical protein